MSSVTLGALRCPRLRRQRTSRMSLETPERPSRPLFLLSTLSISSGVQVLVVASMHSTTAGSRSPRAGAHENALQRRQAHGGIKALAVHRRRCMEEPLPRWQMTILLGLILEAEHFQRAGGHEAVAGAVEAVAADAGTSHSTHRARRRGRPCAAWSDGRRCRTRPPSAYPGITAWQASMPMRLAGLCRGPSGDALLDGVHARLIDDAARR